MVGFEEIRYSGWLRLCSQCMGMLKVVLESMGLSVMISWSR